MGESSKVLSRGLEMMWKIMREQARGIVHRIDLPVNRC